MDTISNSEISSSEKPILNTTVKNPHKISKVRKFVGIILFIIIFGFIALFTVVIPGQIKGNPVVAYSNDQHVFSEKLTYLFRQPQVGDVVMFSPHTNIGATFIGLIVSQKIYEYQIWTAGNSMWYENRNSIDSRVYFPPLKKEQIDESLNRFLAISVSPTPSPALVSPSPVIYSINPSPSIYPSVSPKIIATPYPTVAPTPLPSPDTQAPVIESMTGPADGSTVDFNNFCFPVYVTDNVSKSGYIYIRQKFDSDTWRDWNTDYSNCYNNVGNGSHFFVIQAKDEAGNTSSEIRRNFTVNVSTPSPSSL